MHFSLIKNPDDTQKLSYAIARLVFAETGGTSLKGAEALSSMIYNYAQQTGIDYKDIIQDKEIFESLSEKSKRHHLLKVPADNRSFQMCLRVVKRMLKGNLQDSCNGATRFHRSEFLPSWATAKGYIADVSGMLFYL